MRQSIATWMAVIACGMAGNLPAAESLKPANERFAAETEEAPSFQRHVLPLMGRLGCNGRSCHGSFQGQGGFRPGGHQPLDNQQVCIGEDLEGVGEGGAGGAV